MQFGVFDIEARDWNKFLLLGTYDIFNREYREFNSIESFINFLFTPDNKQTKFYAHFGGIYDFLFILDFYLSHDEDFEFYSIINQGSKILSFKLRERNKKRKAIQFICSSGLFPFSLKELTHSFDVEHKKLDDDASLFKKVTPKMRKYLEHDCKGLAEAIEKYSSEYFNAMVGLKLTRSSQSLAVFNEFFCDELPVIKNEVSSFAREAYLGGRTEIFKPLFKPHGKFKKLNEYDINSLYPSVMSEERYPAQFSHFSIELDDEYEHFIIHCTITCPKDIYVPLLGIKYDGKFIFPTGTFDGHFCSPEIKKALELGYKIEKIHRIAYFHDAGFIFKEFIDKFYNERLKTDSPVKKIVYKDFMNHLYGRLAIRQEREVYSFKPTEKSRIHCKYKIADYTVRLYADDKLLRTYSNPALSAFVTSYARLKLYSYFEKCDFDIYYCDTDSVYTPRKLENSKELGKMKLEDTHDECCFLLPKTYAKYSYDTKKLDLKMKGFPSKKGELSHLTYKDFLNCLEGSLSLPSVKIERGLARFKTGLKKDDVLLVLPPQEKQLKAKYDKRYLVKLKNGLFDSKPINIEYQNTLF